MKRLCPKCGKKTQEARCPDDGTATLVLAQNPDAKLSEGTEVNGRYLIDRIIGQGGFGAVYKAKNMATDQDIAIKLLAVSLDSDDSDLIQRFFAEAQVTASLKHPNTIKVFDFGQTEGGALYIAMELLSGRPLNEELRDRLALGQVFSEHEVVTIASQVLRSLAEAHSANLVHRDLKPHNIFLHQVEGDDPVVKVLDFGIAKRLGSNLTGTGKAFGTPTYMSPEQAQNKNVDRRSDIYSLGCVLYQLVAGRPPFEGDNPLAILFSHVSDTPADLRTTAKTPISDAFASVIEKALAKNPEDRFATALEMRQALEATRTAERTDRLRVTAMPGQLEPSIGETEAATESYEAVLARSRTTAYATPPPVTPGSVPPKPQGRVITGVPPSLRQPTPVAPTAVPIPTAPGQLTQTQGFFANSAVEDSLAALDRQTQTPPKSSRMPLVLGAIAALVLLAIAAVWALGGSEPPQPPPAEPKVAAAIPSAAAVPPAKETPPEPPKVVKAEPAAPGGPVRVEVVTEPPGASVKAGDKVLGKSPLAVSVEGDKRLTLLIQLDGYTDRELDVTKGDAPSLTVQLRKEDAADDRAAEVKKPSAGAAKSKPPGPKTGGEKSGGTKSALEERL